MDVGSKTRVFVIDPDSFGGLNAVYEAATAGRPALVALVNPSDDNAVYRADSPAIIDAPSFYKSIIMTYALDPLNDPVLYARYSTTGVDLSYDAFISSYVDNGKATDVDIFILRINKLTVEVPGVGSVAISSTTNPEFKKTNAVKVDPADAYWFEELHNADKATVYYVTLSGNPIEPTLSGYMDVATKIAPDAYVNHDDPPETKMPILFKEISGYSHGGVDSFKADGTMFDPETDDEKSIKYYVVQYDKKSGSDK